MPSKKKKYNARFPAGRIKKIMQTDEEVGKVAQAVPIIISRTLELFVESLLTKSMQITQSRNAKTLTPSHMKQCILSESRFDFLKDLVKNIPDASIQEDNENNAKFLDEKPDDSETSITQSQLPILNTQSTSRTPVIQYSSKTPKTETPKITFSVNNLLGGDECGSSEQCNSEVPAKRPSNEVHLRVTTNDVPPLIPISHNYCQCADDNLCIDEDYDN